MKVSKSSFIILITVGILSYFVYHESGPWTMGIILFLYFLCTYIINNITQEVIRALRILTADQQSTNQIIARVVDIINQAVSGQEQKKDDVTRH